MVRSHGYAVSNADITIAAQRPKLAPYIVRMRQTLADILGVDISQVSVKATTTEHLGFTGREEGIAVWASVLLNRSDGGDMQRREMWSFRPLHISSCYCKARQMRTVRTASATSWTRRIEAPRSRAARCRTWVWGRDSSGVMPRRR